MVVLQSMLSFELKVLCIGERKNAMTSLFRDKIKKEDDFLPDVVNESEEQ